jgi:delta24-sterol reductase
MDAHHTAVKSISQKVHHFHTTKTPFRIYHGSTNSTRHTDFDRNAIVDVSRLNNILSIDQSNRTALVEPNVPMDLLVQASMRSGLIPPVVMEFPGITVGGGFVGTAGESSSFRHGFFDQTVVRVEVVLADGEVVNASKEENFELFEGLRGSFGTLGVLTLVELRLVDVRRFVEVRYIPTTGFENAAARIREETERKDVDYVDGILFSKNEGVVVAGRLTDQQPSSILPLRRFSKPWNEWFWIHARAKANSSHESTVELVPIQDYLFRYDRGAFWTGMYAFSHFMVPFTWFTRFLLDYFMHTRIMYHALHASGHTDRYIIQDIAIPAPNTEGVLDWVDGRLGMYPLWLCPLRKDGRRSMGHPREYRRESAGGGFEGEYINVGIWGPYPSSEADYIRINRALEEKVQDVGGLKWLYGRVFYTEDEWWKIYDQSKYNALREKYRATGLPSIWEKVKHRGRKEEVEPGIKGMLKRIIRKNGFLSGVYGVYKALRGGDYMLRKNDAQGKEKIG